MKFLKHWIHFIFQCIFKIITEAFATPRQHLFWRKLFLKKKVIFSHMAQEIVPVKNTFDLIASAKLRLSWQFDAFGTWLLKNLRRTKRAPTSGLGTIFIIRKDKMVRLSKCKHCTLTNSNQITYFFFLSF